MAISFGGDPENYMDPPQMTHSQVGDGGPSFVASLFALLGIHRNVARGPKEQKESKVKTAAAQTLKEQSKTPDAQSWTDSTEIGRASWRERVGQYVQRSGVGVSL